MGTTNSLPLSFEDYHIRQKKFLKKLPDKTVVLIPTNPVSFRSNDTTYPYRASSYMLYLCGCDAPESIFMAYQASEKWVTSIFVRPRDTKAEIWEGRRIGVEGASSHWPIDEAYSITDMKTTIAEKLNDCNNIYSILGVNDSLDDITKISDIEILDPRLILDDMRVIKSEGEIKLMQNAATIASQAHVEGMKNSFSGIGEWELQSIIESYFTSKKSCPQLWFNSWWWR